MDTQIITDPQRRGPTWITSIYCFEIAFDNQVTDGDGHYWNEPEDLDDYLLDHALDEIVIYPAKKYPFELSVYLCYIVIDKLLTTAPFDGDVFEAVLEAHDEEFQSNVEDPVEYTLKGKREAAFWLSIYVFFRRRHWLRFVLEWKLLTFACNRFNRVNDGIYIYMPDDRYKAKFRLMPSRGRQ